MFYLNIPVLQKYNPLFKEGRFLLFWRTFYHMFCQFMLRKVHQAKLIKSLSRHRMQCLSSLDWISPLPAINCSLSASCVSDQTVWSKCRLEPQGFGREINSLWKHGTESRPFLNYLGGAVVSLNQTMLFSVEAAETTEHKLCWWNSWDT